MSAPKHAKPSPDVVAGEIVDRPMVTWPEALTDEARGAIERDATHFAERYTRLAAYAHARSLGRTHDAAVKYQNRVARALRKALGFSYPEKADVTF